MSIVRKYQVLVKDVQNPVEDIFTVELESLSGIFRYKPGQFLHLALDEYDPTLPWPDSRCFSMQSSPNNKNIKITYSVKGRFTNRMKSELSVGKIVTLKLPYGNLFSQEYIKENTVFISGGTGITPFLSFFNDSSFSYLQSPILFAGFRSRSMNLYQTEIEKAGKINPSFKIYLTYQDEEGILDIQKIYNMTHSNSSYFISGPPLMINSFKNFLLQKGMPAKQILTDDWE